MRVAIVRSMPNFSMDVYADGLIAGLRNVRPNWEIIELVPHPIDRHSRSLRLRAHKFYERFWNFPQRVQRAAAIADVVHIVDHSEGHIVPRVKKTKTPVVVTCHDLINLIYRDNLQGSVQLPFISSGLWMHSVRSMEFADHIIAVSSLTAKDISHLLAIEPSRVTVVPNAVEPLFQPLPFDQIVPIRQQRHASPETICLLNVGASYPRKNLATVLAVVDHLKQQGLPVQLWKAGADFTAEQKQFIQRQQLNQHIHHFGNPDKAALVEIYNAADILIAPSLHEGFGLTLLEAMSCGTPVITSNTSAMPEVVGDAGILVEPIDVDAIVDAVVHLAKDTVARRSLSQQGVERSRLFTWEKTAEQIAQVYEQLVAASDPLGHS